MARRFKPFQPLLDEQAAASAPESFVWLSASAGTGKTHVLSARVLRLLLNGVDPSAILCLTFTKAGAAEMADRIHERLAHWVRLPDALLRKDLFALGEPHADADVAAARTLFARVLDAPGGGLRIQTIHAFCQTLLAAFPLEAGLVPGFRPMDARVQAALARETLAQMMVDAEAGGDLPLVGDVQALSLRLGEEGAEGFLMACARRPDAMAALGPGVEAKLRRLFGVPDGDVEQALADACHDSRFNCAGLRAIAAANTAWGTATGAKQAERAAAFLAAGPAERAALIDDLALIVLTSAGEPRKASAKLIAAEPDYEAHAAALGDACRALAELRAKAALAKALTAALRAGQAYARAYEAAKRQAGAVDFDDLIRHVARLLGEPGMGDWVRYKLDRETDHILIDEAQDTNVDQWSIVAGLAAEYFAGSGAKGEHRLRTIFTVGDFKQAIFGFQGTSPEAFRLARGRFGRYAEEAGRPFADLGLDRSFRSTPPVLAFVDRLIGDLGPAAFGLERAPPPHRATPSKAKLPGAVTIFAPTSPELAAEIGDDGEEGWVEDAVRLHASRIAKQVRAWLDEGLPLAGGRRAVRPEDIMILARKRGELVPLIVARLHAEGVPVAGVDRLRLTAPLGVRDLLAAMRFALQPGDDLNLANLLVSPLIGCTQEALFAAAYKRRGTLWDAVRGRGDEAAEALAAILARADYTTPYRFLEELLSGPVDGRRKLLARLGEEARDPIDELLGAALRFEGEATPTLQRFVDWFDRGDVEITRDPAAPLDAVRVMTVHGSKGLQAPLVILADAAADPDAAPATSLTLAVEAGVEVPLFRLRKEETHGPIADAAAAVKEAGRQEHWRLLYVAATRAEERLVVTGALGTRAKGVPPDASWYAAADRALDAMGADRIDDPLWGSRRDYGGESGYPASAPRTARAATAPPVATPDWLRRPAPTEQRPPRPLAPSAIGQDRVADPPPDAAMRVAARRGELLHALFKRLPRIAPERRSEAAERWLRESAGVEDAADRRALAADACAILADPRFAAIFHPDALAEAPLAAVVEGEVIAGTVDRLLVEADRVLVVDFKTGRRIPASLDQAPDHHLDQMAAYAAALAAIFPGRRIEAALLYTSGPRLIALPTDLLAARKPGYAAREQSLAAGR